MPEGAGGNGETTALASEGADLKARPLNLGPAAVSNDGQVLHVISKTHRKSRRPPTPSHPLSSLSLLMGDGDEPLMIKNVLAQQQQQQQPVLPVINSCHSPHTHTRTHCPNACHDHSLACARSGPPLISTRLLFIHSLHTFCSLRSHLAPPFSSEVLLAAAPAPPFPFFLFFFFFSISPPVIDTEAIPFPSPAHYHRFLAPYLPSLPPPRLPCPELACAGPGAAAANQGRRRRTSSNYILHSQQEVHMKV